MRQQRSKHLLVARIKVSNYLNITITGFVSQFINFAHLHQVFIVLALQPCDT